MAICGSIELSSFTLQVAVRVQILSQAFPHRVMAVTVEFATGIISNYYHLHLHLNNLYLMTSHGRCISKFSHAHLYPQET
jgi:hypothetical protein